MDSLVGLFPGGFGFERFGLHDFGGLEHEFGTRVVILSCSLSAGVGELFFVFFGGFDGFTDFVLDDSAGAGVLLTRGFDDDVEVVRGGIGDGESSSREGGDLFAVDNHADDEVAVGHLNEVGAFKGGLELFDEERGVVSGDAEGDGGADVTKDGVAYGVGHLGDVLVGDGEVEAVFASLGENDGKRVGGEVLELVDVEVEWTAVFYVGDVGAGHGGELDLGDEEGAENAGVVFANETFGEVDDEDFAFVHDFADIKAGFGLADDIANDGVGSEGADLVQNWGDGLGDLFVTPGAELLFPALEDGNVFTIVESFFAEVFIGEHAGDV